jgi:hypothetical protein
MRTVYGISLSLGSFERGLWFDHDRRDYQPEGWGIRLHIAVGKLIRPVPKFWYSKKQNRYKHNNPWKGDEPWFVIRLPIIIGPFISIALGRFGAYLGCKTFLVTEAHLGPDRYGKWLTEDERRVPGEYLQLTATTRRTRWK